MGRAPRPAPDRAGNRARRCGRDGIGGGAVHATPWCLRRCRTVQHWDRELGRTRDAKAGLELVQPELREKHEKEELGVSSAGPFGVVAPAGRRQGNQRTRPVPRRARGGSSSDGHARDVRTIQAFAHSKQAPGHVPPSRADLVCIAVRYFGSILSGCHPRARTAHDGFPAGARTDALPDDSLNFPSRGEASPSRG